MTKHTTKQPPTLAKQLASIHGVVVRAFFDRSVIAVQCIVFVPVASTHKRTGKPVVMRDVAAVGEFRKHEWKTASAMREGIIAWIAEHGELPAGTTIELNDV